jgi:hypothetical protein
LFRNQTVSLRIEKNGGRLFRRPKLTLSSSAEGKEGRKMAVLACGCSPGTHFHNLYHFLSCVEAKENTSTVAQQVIEGDEEGTWWLWV